MMYGYARVSDPAQDHARQVAELTAAGCERIYQEKRSAAAGRKRPALRQAIAVLQPGDVLVFTALDRFARSARDALNVLASVTEKGAAFRSLAEPWADTTTPIGALLVTVLVGFAEFDRAMILKRTGEGRRAAKERGVRLGRPSTLTPAQKAFVRAQLDARAQSTTELAALLRVSESTITRAARTAPPAGEGPPPAWHAPSCAAFTAGAGNTARCTCGGAGRGAAGRPQIDIEELTR